MAMWVKNAYNLNVRKFRDRKDKHTSSESAVRVAFMNGYFDARNYVDNRHRYKMGKRREAYNHGLHFKDDPFPEKLYIGKWRAYRLFQFFHFT